MACSPDIPKMELLFQLADGTATHVVQTQVDGSIVNTVQVVNEVVWNAPRLRENMGGRGLGRSQRWLAE